MLIRIEAFGRVLHVEYGKPDPDDDSTPAPSDAAYPMQVPTPEFVGFIRADPTQPEDARRVHHPTQEVTPG